MNMARYVHSSCTLGNKLYVLAGINLRDDTANFIEKLDNIDRTAVSTFSSWQLIQLTEFFKPRQRSVFYALNERELIVLGGVHSNQYFG